MPTYDYICDACNHEFESFESIKADPQTVCPQCQESNSPQDRRRGRDHLQRVGLLPDRLSQRLLQEARGRRQDVGLVLEPTSTTPAPAKTETPKASGNGTP